MNLQTPPAPAAAPDPDIQRRQMLAQAIMQHGQGAQVGGMRAAPSPLATAGTLAAMYGLGHTRPGVGTPNQATLAAPGAGAMRQPGMMLA